MVKRILSVFLPIVLLVSLLAFPADAATSGFLGNNIRWSYNSNTHTLTITGTGDMPDSYEHNMAPWRYYSDCKPIDHVVVGEGITRIGSEAFEHMTLQSIQLPSTLKTIGGGSFERVTFESGTLTIPSKVTTIEGGAFKEAKLTSLHLPASVQSIGGSAFYNTPLQTINLENVKSIGSNAFYNASLVGTLDLTNLEYLGQHAFDRCLKVTGVQFGTKLTEIPAWAFYWTGIFSLDLPGSIRSVGQEAFWSCPIHTLKLHEGLEYIGSYAFTLALYEELELPSSLISINTGGLSDYNSQSVYLNEGLNMLGVGAISWQRVLTIPSTVTMVGPRSNETLIVLGRPFESASDYAGGGNWNAGNTFYTWYPKDQWGYNGEYDNVEFQMLEPETTVMYVGQSLPVESDASEYQILDGRRVKLENGILTAVKPCADVLIETNQEGTFNHLIRVMPLPASCGPEHIWNLVGSTPSNCSVHGERQFSCMVCGAAKTEELPLDPDCHIWDAGTVSTEPTCTDEGMTSYQCTGCGEFRYEPIPALGHIWTYTETLTEDPETGHGTALYTCSRCNETKEGRLCAGEIFIDMPPEDFWSHDPIDWAWLNGITGGTGPDTFSPDLTVTRSQVVTFLWAAAEKPAPETTTSPFTDVKEGDWFLSPVLWAVENGVTGGVGNNQFGPGAVCTRSQIVTFLWAAAGKPEPEMTESPFTDVKEGDWYLKAVLWAVENGVTGGIGNNQFGPDLVCSRAQAVTFLYKASQIPATEAPAEP